MILLRIPLRLNGLLSLFALLTALVCTRMAAQLPVEGMIPLFGPAALSDQPNPTAEFRIVDAPPSPALVPSAVRLSSPVTGRSPVLSQFAQLRGCAAYRAKAGRESALAKSAQKQAYRHSQHIARAGSDAHHINTPPPAQV